MFDLKRKFTCFKIEMKENNRNNIAGMIFHPPNLITIDETASKLLPFVGPIYRRLPPITKKRILLRLQPFKYFYIKDITSLVRGRIDLLGLMLPMLPEQILIERKKMALKKILDLLIKAETVGVGIITLGSFTSIITNQGRDIENKVSLAITSGNTYTAALCVKSVFKICQKLEVDLKKVSIGIIGATGDIGSSCARVLSRYVKQLILCSRSINEHSDIVVEVRKGMSKMTISNNPKECIRKADFIICAASAFDPLFDSEDIRPGTIICDLSMPPNIVKNILNQRNDIFAFEGGRAKMPGFDQIKNIVWSTLFPSNSLYGCLAESLILAFEGRYENYSLGRGTISEEKMREIYGLGLKHGFDVADFSCFGYFYTEEDFKRIKVIRRGNVK